jgi:hypothetical protein
MIRHRRGASPEGGHAGGIFRSPLPGTTVPLDRPGALRCRPGAGCGGLLGDQAELAAPAAPGSR